MLNDRGSVIVTGASRGIGAATAAALAAKGYAVAVNYARDEAGAVTVAGAIAGQGGTARAYRADVSLEGEVEALFDNVSRDLGPVAGLVNNAGITGGLCRVEDISAALLQEVFAINVTGAFLCAREAVRRMSTKRGGRGGVIINISSRAAEIGGAGEWVHYAASKGAIDTLTAGLAKEVAAEGIRVCAVAPGLIETTLHEAAGAFDRLQRLGPGVPLGRAGSAVEVASAVVWLMSPEAAYVTGCTLPVSGGR